MADVFISHSSLDKEIADRLCSYLEMNGLKCWIAPRDIEPGAEWPVAISEAIQDIKVMVVIYSHNSATSTQVPKELTLADKRKKKIIPYKIDDAELLGTFEYFLSGAHWITEDKVNPNASLQNLLHVICHVLGLSAPQNSVAKQNVLVQPAKPLATQPAGQTVQKTLGQPVQSPVGQPVKQTLQQPVKQTLQQPVKQTVQQNKPQSVVKSNTNPAKKTKKKHRWILPVCIGGVLLVLGVVFSIIVGLFLIGIGSGTQDGYATESNEKLKVTDVENFEYDIDDNGVTITQYIGSEREVVVPSKIEGKPVVQIGVKAFANNNIINTVYLPNSVAYICPGAFSQSSLETIYLSNGLKRIEDSVFWGCSNLRAITLPNTLYSIDNYAFSESGLESIVIPDSVELIMNGAFWKCTQLKTVTFSNQLKSIGPYAFAYSVITEAVLPGSVTYIGDGAFFECMQLQSVKMPSGLMFIPNDCFYSCVNLTQVILPDNLIKIDSYAFGNTGISELDLSVVPLRYIGNGAFSECQNLSSVKFPELLQKIDRNAFAFCPSLSEVILPNAIRHVSSTAFASSEGAVICYGDSSYTYNGLQELSDALDSVLASDFSFVISENGLMLTEYLGNDPIVVIPEQISGTSVEVLGENLFANMESVQLVIIPDSVRLIEAQAFMNCNNLVLLAGGDNVEALGHSAFALTALIQPFLPYRVTSIPANLFYGCNNITDLYVWPDTTTVGAYAFANCSSLTNVCFSDGIQAIDRTAFAESVSVGIYVPYWVYSYDEIEYIPVLVDSTDS